MTSEEIILPELKNLIEKVKSIIFVEGYVATDEETLGIIVSKYCKWDVEKIINVSQAAFEDSNFPSLGEKLEEFYQES